MDTNKGLITCRQGNNVLCSLSQSLRKIVLIALCASIVGIIVYLLAYIIVKLTVQTVVAITTCCALIYNLDYIDNND